VTFGSNRYLTIDLNPLSRVGAYQLYIADVTYTALSERWSLTAFIRNIGETAVANGGFINLGTLNASINPPRTHGVQGRFNF
jgi:iron complex outermembrane receptor protein